MTQTKQPPANPGRFSAKLCDRALRLNPTPPGWYYYFCAGPMLFARRYQESIEFVNRGAAAGSPPNEYMLADKAEAQAQLGQMESAAQTVAELGKRFPEASLERFLNTTWYFARKQDEAQAIAMIHKAGIRICATEDELKQFSKPVRLPECIGKPAD